jgi:hypothetical protein
VALRGRLYTLQQPPAAEQAAAALAVASPTAAAAQQAGGARASASHSRSGSGSEGDWAEVEDKGTLSKQDSGLRRQQQVFRCAWTGLLFAAVGQCQGLWMRWLRCCRSGLCMLKQVHVPPYRHHCRA